MMISNRNIRIPVYTPTPVVDFASINFTPPNTSISFREMVIDIQSLKMEYSKVIKNYMYNGYIPGGINKGLLIIGRDVIARISNFNEEEIPPFFHQELMKIDGLTIVINAQTTGVAIIPFVESPTPRREVTDRERMSEAHIKAVIKVTAERGRAQRNTYADGWMACLRVLCEGFGIEVPEARIPFKGMYIEDIMIEKVIEELGNASNIESSETSHGSLLSRSEVR